MNGCAEKRASARTTRGHSDLVDGSVCGISNTAQHIKLALIIAATICKHNTAKSFPHTDFWQSKQSTLFRIHIKQTGALGHLINARPKIPL